MKTDTEQDWKNKAETYCSSAERCPCEVERKLMQWGADKEAAGRILASLREDRFLDTTRYCRAFVRDKYRFARWGRTKIIQALRMKHLPPEDIAAGLDSIDEEEYRSILDTLLRQKQKQLADKDSHDLGLKLIRFAMGKGFTLDEIRHCIDHVSTDEFLD